MIDDRDPTPRKTVLHIFREEDPAAVFNGKGQD